MVACFVCGMKFDVSARAYRYYQAGQREARCMIHKTGPEERQATKIAARRREILNQHSKAEIFLMGWALEMTLTGRRLPVPASLADQVTRVKAEWLALAASADAPS